jgi:hypothetical protein
MVVAAEDDGKPLQNLSEGCRKALDDIVNKL